MFPQKILWLNDMNNLIFQRMLVRNYKILSYILRLKMLWNILKVWRFDGIFDTRFNKTLYLIWIETIFETCSAIYVEEMLQKRLLKSAKDRCCSKSVRVSYRFSNLIIAFNMFSIFGCTLFSKIIWALTLHYELN